MFELPAQTFSCRDGPPRLDETQVLEACPYIYIISLGRLMRADDVDGKSGQRNDDEYRDQNGRRNPHQDAQSRAIATY